MSQAKKRKKKKKKKHLLRLRALRLHGSHIPVLGILNLYHFDSYYTVIEMINDT